MLIPGGHDQRRDTNLRIFRYKRAFNVVFSAVTLHYINDGYYLGQRNIRCGQYAFRFAHHGTTMTRSRLL